MLGISLNIWSKVTGAGDGFTTLLSKIFCTDPTLPTDTELTRSGVTATVTDFEGLVKGPLPANEARMWGQRRVENLLGGLAGPAAYNGASVSGTSEDNGYELVGVSGGLVRFGGTHAGTQTPTVYRARFQIKKTSGSGDVLVDVNDDTANDVNITPTDDWVTYSVKGVRVSGGAIFRLLDFSFSSTLTVEIRYAQFEDVTGQTDTSPGEYVSVGVGTGSELVTNGTFDTDASDWTPHSSAILSMESNRLKVESPVNYDGAYQDIDTVRYKTYVVSFDVIAGSANGRIYIGNYASRGEYRNTGGLTTGTYTYQWTTTNSLASRIGLAVDSATANDCYFDNVTVKEASHGAFIDGVKYFSTANGNTVDGNGVVTEATGAALTNPIRGLLIEKESATNLLTYSIPDALPPTNWTDYGGMSASSLVLMDNGQQGIRYQETASRPRIDQTINLSASTTYTLRVYVEPGGVITSGSQQIVNIKNFVGATGALTANLGDEDARGYITLTFTTSTDTNGNIQIGPGISANVDCDVTIGIPQLEIGPHATSFIPTGASTVQRDAENVYFHAAQPTDGFVVLSMAWPTGYDTATADGTDNGILSWDEEGSDAVDYQNLLYQQSGTIGRITSDDEGTNDTTVDIPMAAYEPVEYAVWISDTDSEYGMGAYGNDTSAPDACQWEGADWAAGVAHSQAYPTDPADATLLGVGYSQDYPMIFMGLLIAERAETDSTYLEANYEAFGCGCE